MTFAHKDKKKHIATSNKVNNIKNIEIFKYHVKRFHMTCGFTQGWMAGPGPNGTGRDGTHFLWDPWDRDRMSVGRVPSRSVPIFGVHIWLFVYSPHAL